MTTPPGPECEEQSIGSVIGTGQPKGPWNSYFRGPFTYFRWPEPLRAPTGIGGPAGNRETGRVEMYTVVHAVVAPVSKADLAARR